MQTKQFEIRLDMQQALPFHPFEVIEGDTGNVVVITLLNDGEEMLLNDCAVVVAFTSSKGFAMQDATSGVTIGEEAGVFSLLLDPDSYGPGNVSADVQIYSGPGNRVLVTSTRFDFRCKRSLISEEIIRANAAYPPLISATLACEQATANANAAVESIASSLGELNVQSDWTETDSASDAFILHKPQTPWDLGAPEEIHAYQHAAAGDDPITPAAIGAAEATHASAHGSDGSDPVTPASIGAAELVSGKVKPDQASSPVSAITESRTISAADAGKLFLVSSAEAVTITLPANADVAIPTGTEFEFARWSTGTVTFAAGTDAVIVSSSDLKSIATQCGCVAVKKVSADKWLLAGDLG